MKKSRRIFLFLLIFAAVQSAAADGAPEIGRKQGDTFEFDGEIVHVALEGGFWAVVAKDGRRFDPGQIPPEFQQVGMRVHVVARRAHGRISFRQWGAAIDVVRLERLERR